IRDLTVTGVQTCALPIYHEYVHSLLHMNSRWLPVWLDEGLAEFYGNTRFDKTKIYVGNPTPSASVLLQKPLIPLEKLLDVDQASPSYHDEDKVHIFYAESWAMIHFLMLAPQMDHGKRLKQFFTLLE